MDSGSLAELRQGFEDHLRRANNVIQFRDAATAQDPLFLTHCGNLKTELDSLEAVLKLMQEEVAKQKQQTQSYAQELRTAATTLVERAQYMEQNLPPRLPPVKPQQDADAGDSKQGRSRGAGRSSADSTVSKTSDADVSKSSSDTAVKRAVCPSIEYLTMEEFEAVPKYIKGRLQYQQVNKTIEELNKTFQAKYKMLAEKKSKLTDMARKRVATYRQQETKDTKDVYFVVEADMKDFSSIRMDRSMFAQLTLLRNCGRMREIRGGCLTRYAIIEMY